MGLTTKEISSSSFNDMISSIDRRSEFVENRAGANVTTNNALISYGLSNSCSILNAPCGYSNGVYPSLTPIKTFGQEADFDFTRDSSATRVNEQGLVESIASGLPRIDYTSGEGSLLLEPQRTNSLLYSNLFTWSGWSKAGAGTGSAPTVTGDYAISPDGSQNASRLQLDKGSGTTTSDYSFMYETVTSVGTGSISIWMKSNDSNTYQVALRESNFIVCDVTPEWQRFELNNQASTNEIQIMLRGTYGTSNNADILIYGAQLEEGSYATSYIPTNGSTVTRLADVCNNSGNADLINSTEGVLYFEGSALDTTNDFEFGLYGDSIAEQCRMVFQNGIVRAQLYNGAYQTLMSYTFDLTNNSKIAFKFKENDFALWINGTEVVTDNLGTTFSVDTLEKLNLANVGGTVKRMTANVKCVAVFKEALTDAELQQLTTI